MLFSCEDGINTCYKSIAKPPPSANNPKSVFVKPRVFKLYPLLYSTYQNRAPSVLMRARASRNKAKTGVSNYRVYKKSEPFQIQINFIHKLLGNLV